MAAGAAVKMRITNLHDSAYAKMHLIPDLIERIGFGASRNAILINIIFEGDFPTTAAEISTPNAVFDGTEEAVKVHVVCANAADDGTSAEKGAGCWSVILIGIDENDLYVWEEILTNGTTGVASANNYKRLLHAFCYTFGTNGVSNGIIYVKNVAEDATYLTIDAAAIDSDGSRLWIPADYDLYIHGFCVGVAETVTSENVGVKFDIGNYAIPSDFDYLKYSTNVSNLFPVDQLIEQPSTERELQILIETLGASAISAYINICMVIVPMTNVLREVPI